MDSIKKVLSNLKTEYLELNDKISRASFALSTMKFDDDYRMLLEEQVGYMIQYSQVIEKRAAMVAKKKEEN